MKTAWIMSQKLITANKTAVKTIRVGCASVRLKGSGV